jgi:eukaryotic-like serine/threonine-protein kinase
MPDGPDDETLSQSAGQESFTSIGPYRLVQLLGVGGMGEVWRAEQSEPLHRTVALKLIKAGMDTKAVVARFESERQALALMEHPSIAKVFDAGATAAGRPYFVMEYVHGLPVTDFCDKHRLTIKKRLDLFIQICEGVQHAHQKAIIHRDLKPSNVLVEEVDNKPIPKIIDFGLAKATGGRLTEMTMFTEMGAMLGTPDYMSPEQADRDERNIDTRTDVYSLGVILYELLVGALPFESKELRQGGVEAMLQKICHQDPPRPSTRLKSMRESSKDSGAKRREEPQALERHLRGDLDWITIKALEKDRTRRYGSPSDLAADIRRYLQNEPVLAGPPSARYRAGKFVRRHRFGVGVTAVVAVLLLGFATTMAVQARRIAKERDRANREAETSKRVTEFMTNMFKVSDPSQAKGNTITAREILDRASNDIDTGLASDPRLQAQMMSIMGNVYENLGLFSRAEPLLAKAADIRQRILGARSPETMASMDELAKALRDLGRNSEAEKIERDTLATEQRYLGADKPETLRSMSQLAWTLYQEGHYPEAEKLDRKSLEAQRRVLGTDDPQTLSTLNDLAQVMRVQGNYADAEKMDQEALETRRRVLGRDHLQTSQSMTNLASDLAAQGHYAEAEKLDRENLEICRRVLGPEHPHTLGAISNLSDDLVSQGLYPEAERLGREALEIEQRVLGPEHPQTVDAMDNLATIQSKQGQYTAAEKLDREILEIRRRVLGPEHPDTARSTYALAHIAALTGRKELALSLLRQAVEHGLPLALDRGIGSDPDFASLHGDPRFEKINAEAHQRLVSERSPNLK